MIGDDEVEDIMDAGREKGVDSTVKVRGSNSNRFNGN